MLEPLEPSTLGQPCYEVIKREDLIGAFQEALTRSMEEVLSRINEFINIYVAVTQPSLWTWDNTSRWDYDTWW